MIAQQSVVKIQRRGTTKAPRLFVWIIIFLSATVLSAFAKKKPSLSLVDRQSEAQMVTIPLPVGGVFVPVKKDSVGHGDAVATHDNAGKGSVLTYSVTTKHDELVSFYEEEMMRLGWNKLAQSSHDEEILIFESPSKIAIIEMRPETPKKGWKRSKKIIVKLHELTKEKEAGF